MTKTTQEDQQNKSEEQAKKEQEIRDYVNKWGVDADL